MRNSVLTLNGISSLGQCFVQLVLQLLGFVLRKGCDYGLVLPPTCTNEEEPAYEQSAQHMHGKQTDSPSKYFKVQGFGLIYCFCVNIPQYKEIIETASTCIFLPLTSCFCLEFRESPACQVRVVQVRDWMGCLAATLESALKQTKKLMILWSFALSHLGHLKS